MSRCCDLTGKSVQTGHTISHSNIKTKRRFLPNLHSLNLYSKTCHRYFRLKVAGSILRQINKLPDGLDAFICTHDTTRMSDRAKKIKSIILRNFKHPIIEIMSQNDLETEPKPKTAPKTAS